MRQSAKLMGAVAYGYPGYGIPYYGAPYAVPYPVPAAPAAPATGEAK